MAVSCPTSVCQVASFPGCLQLGEGLGTRLHTLLDIQFGLVPRLPPFSLGTRPEFTVCTCVLSIGGVGLLQDLWSDCKA